MILENLVILFTKKEESIILAHIKHNSAIYCFILVTYTKVFIIQSDNNLRDASLLI